MEPVNIAPVWVVLLLAGCQRPQAQQAFDYGAGIGIAVEKADGVCLDIRNGALATGRRIQFVNSSEPRTTGELEITGKADRACTAIDQNTPGLYHYGFRVVRGSLEQSAPAFVLVNGNGDGQPKSFRSCASTEGLHLTVWEGEPLVGRRKWHYYYYLGYDVEANCEEADTKPDTP